MAYPHTPFTDMELTDKYIYIAAYCLIESAKQVGLPLIS